MSCYCDSSYLGRNPRGRGGGIRARSSGAADVTAEIADAASEALGDFVDACMAARAQSLGFKDLQLKLLLAEAALPTPFSMMMGAGAGEEGEGVGGEIGGAEASLGDFVDACMAARAQSLGFKDLQLKLLLAEAALPAPFSMMMGAAGAGEEGEEGEAEGGRGAGSNAVDNIRSGEGYEGVVSADGSQPPDPTDGFVQQNVKAAFDQGRDYNFVRMEQEAQATPVPPSIATLQQIQLLILLALSKGMAATA
ncbi:unnamed protein product [Closterium sp. NIES-64]|nr:unnamed protein product [Closterium sp. NIES-64]